MCMYYTVHVYVHNMCVHVCALVYMHVCVSMSAPLSAGEDELPLTVLEL